MKNSATVLVLLALLALVPCTQALTQAPPAATPPASSATAAPLDLADFLATLSGDQSPAPGAQVLTPSPKFLSTTCTTSADCLPNQKCCYPCGIPDCEWVCMTVKRCPLIP